MKNYTNWICNAVDGVLYDFGAVFGWDMGSNKPKMREALVLALMKGRPKRKKKKKKAHNG